MKPPPHANWFFLPVFVIALAGCSPAPRGQWIWEVPEKGSTQRPTIIRIYDVSDLTGHGWKNRSVYYPGGASNCFPDPRKPPPPPVATGKEPLDACDLASLIQTTVDCDNWREAGGEVATLETYGPFLIIRQTPRVHQEIEGLLSSLRAAMNRK